MYELQVIFVVVLENLLYLVYPADNIMEVKVIVIFQSNNNVVSVLVALNLLECNGTVYKAKDLCSDVV